MKERKTEHPILFSGAMVRAILDGRKTMTRRVVKPQPTVLSAGVYADRYNGGPEWAFWLPDNRMTEPRTWPCPYGQPGDRLWGRETWQAIHVSIDPETGHGDEVTFAAEIPEDDRGGYWSAVYAATDAQASDHRDDRGFPWRPSIHMPRWASRLTLTVTEIRVERLQAISEEDARAEGATPCEHPMMHESTYRRYFAGLWDQINGKRPGCSWADDPWVWVVSFCPEGQAVLRRAER